MSAPEHLLPLARTYGVSTDGRTVPFVHRGLACRISLDYSSGMVVGLEGHVRTQTLPDVGFRTEATIDRVGKSLLVAREAQLGDPEFDPFVYVDTRAPDATVRALLASRAARAALRSLVAETGALRFDHDGIHWSEPERDGIYGAARLTRILDGIAELVAALPANASEFVAANPPRPRHAQLVIAIAASLVFVISAPVAMLLYTRNMVPLDPLPPLAAGFGVDIALTATSVLAGLAAFGRRSDGFRAVLGIMLGAFFGGLPVGPAAVVIANCAFDAAPATAIAFPIVAHSIEQGDEGPYLSVDMRTPYEPGDTFSVSLPNGPLPGPKSSLVLNVYPGALGWPWHDRLWVVGVR